MAEPINKKDKNNIIVLKTQGAIIGVLALQGAFREHIKSVNALGAEAREVRKPEQLSGISGLIIPGGESTAIGKLMVEYRLIEPIKKLAMKGLSIFGTCAGMIALAKKTTEGTQPLLELMDIEVRRNAFGRQVDSFESDLFIPVIGKQSYRAIFIRAPWIERAGAGVKPLASVKYGDCDKIVLAEQDNLLVSAFHPELTDDLRIHKYFLEKITNLDSQLSTQMKEQHEWPLKMVDDKA